MLSLNQVKKYTIITWQLFLELYDNYLLNSSLNCNYNKSNIKIQNYMNKKIIALKKRKVVILQFLIFSKICT